MFHGYAKSSFLDVLHTRKYIIIGYKNRFFGMVLYIIRALDNTTCPAVVAVQHPPLTADPNNMMQNMLAQLLMNMSNQGTGNNTVNPIIQMLQGLQGQASGSSSHISFGNSATRFNPSVSMMGNQSRSIPLADGPFHPAPTIATDAKASSPVTEPDSVTSSVPPPKSPIGSVGPEEVTLVPDDVEVDEEDIYDDNDEADDAERAPATKPMATPAPDTAVVPASPPTCTTLATTTTTVAPSASSTPTSLLAKMEAAMVSAHKARDTAAKQYKAAMKAAAKKDAKKPPVMLALSDQSAEPSPPDSADTVLKKPGAKCIKKRPAAAMEVVTSVPGVSMREAFEKLKLEKGPITRGAFTSRASDTTKRLCKGKCDADTASAFARHNYALASKLYDELKLVAPIKRS